MTGLGIDKESLAKHDIGEEKTTHARIRTCDLRIRNSLQTPVTHCKQRTPENDWSYTGQDSANADTHEDQDLKKIIEG